MTDQTKRPRPRGKVLTNTAINEARPVTVLEPEAALAKQVLPNGLTKADRVTSLRSYRRKADEAIAMAMKGRMTARDAKDLITAIEKAASLMMSERVLAANNMEDLEPDHILGVDGGHAFGQNTYETPMEHKLTRKKGIGNDGNPIDETTIEITGGPEVGKLAPLLAIEQEDDDYE